MRAFTVVGLTLGALSFAAAQYGYDPSQYGYDQSSSDDDWCSTVAEEQYKKLSKGVDPVTQGVNATNLYNCLRQLTLDQDAAMDYLQYAKTYTLLQSTAPILKDPPKSYQQPPVDITARLDDIVTNVKAGKYETQYAFDAELVLLAKSVNDFHFNLNPGIMGSQTFAWSLQYSLTSFSADGQALPLIYVYEDILENSTDWQASPVATLDGRSVMDYIAWAALGYSNVGVGESHTEFNIMMRNAAYTFGLGSPIDISLFTTTQFYRGETLSGTFANGTEFTWSWVGYCVADMTSKGWDKAQQIYDDLVVAPDSSSSSSKEKRQQSQDDLLTYAPPTYIQQYPYYVPILPPAVTQAAAPTASVTKVPAPNYPDATVLQDDFGPHSGVVSGYVYSDDSIAVIMIPSFDTPQKTNLSASFSQAITDTLTEAKKANVKKIVIDVSGNGGGTTFMGYESFRRIFPDIYPYQLIRTQATETQNILGTILDKIIANADGDFSAIQPAAANIAAGTVALSSTLKYTEPNGTARFASWKDFFGPVVANGGNFTNAARFNFDNATLAEGMGLPDAVFGFGDNAIPKDYPRYSPADVVLLTDGFCGSTCSVFAELMRSTANVTTVTVGGLPVDGPMQAISGSRGANVYPWTAIGDVVDQFRASVAASPDLAEKAGLTNDTLRNLPPALSKMQYIGPDRNRVNAIDILRTADDKVPVQFAYEPANCRLFYTREMILDQSAVWRAAAKVSGGDYGACVKNSVNQKGSAGGDVMLDSPGFNNSFQAAVNGSWSGNDTWGTTNIADNSTGGGSGINGGGKKKNVASGLGASLLTVTGIVVAGIFVLLA